MALSCLKKAKAHWKEGVILLILLALSLGFSLTLLLNRPKANIAVIKHHNETILRLDLDKETSPREIVVKGDHGDVTVQVRKGEVSIKESNCPSQFCVHEGWQSGGKPIICAYNGISIFFEDNNGGSVIVG